MKIKKLTEKKPWHTKDFVITKHGLSMMRYLIIVGFILGLIIGILSGVNICHFING